MSLTVIDRIEGAPEPRRLRLVTAKEVVALLDAPRRPQHCDPRPTAKSFARGVAEVMARARPVDQLRDLATFDVVRLIERAATRQPAHRSQSGLVPVVRSVHLADICDGVIEACATVDGGVRSRALAFRLESNGHAWRATVVQLG